VQHVRSEILTEATIAGRDLPKGLADRLIDRAQEKAQSIDYGSPELRAFMSSFHGACAMIALSLRQLHPDVSEEMVGEALSRHREQCRPAVETVMLISGLLSDKPADPAKGGQPTGEAVAGV
jgi:hypothetical protein